MKTSDNLLNTNSKGSPNTFSGIDQRILIDHPNHHYLLPKHSAKSVIHASFVQDLMDWKNSDRKRQRSLSSLFFSIGLCLSLVFVIIAFEWKFYDNNKKVMLSSVQEPMDDIMDIPVTEQPPPPPPKLQQPSIVEVPNEEEIVEEIEIDLDVEVTEETRIEETVEQVMIDEEPEDEVAGEVFTIVEHQPEPKGGFAAFYQFVSENLKYPAHARRMGIEGKVFVQFIVERDGSLTDVEVVKGIGAGCDEEAIRVIGKSPRWDPGKQRGRPVRVKMILPIAFKLYQR